MPIRLTKTRKVVHLTLLATIALLPTACTLVPVDSNEVDDSASSVTNLGKSNDRDYASAVQPVLPARHGSNTGIDISTIYQRSVPSVCTITSVHDATSSTNEPVEDLGTGFFIDSHGDIATNDHVVDGSRSVVVAIGQDTFHGEVLGTDRLDDLAVVHISGIRTQALTLGTATTLVPGQPVVAIGNPFQLTDTVTSGIVSGLHRTMPSLGDREMSDLIQTDAPINPGNSGGPLFDDKGRVVGINTMIVSPVKGSIGIGFAIPIDRFKRVMPTLIAGEEVRYPWIGITGFSITPLLATSYHLPVPRGVFVVSVVPGGPASQAKIRGASESARQSFADGDIITAINGQSVTSVGQLTSRIAAYAIGQRIQVTIYRHATAENVMITLGTFPNSR
ncbi:S1C family serine protease [Alicyclobacillus sp. SP_1]|uniref:S1C family serine protease n=1 Tax=Alicyclobacillus sp. SP_1 TaxID=2942475 RepID=UPI0021580DD4|nr:trypsin-like peptidase domain-containing protein [Alicyclobacillus sp. SP_1]